MSQAIISTGILNGVVKSSVNIDKTIQQKDLALLIAELRMILNNIQNQYDQGHVIVQK